MKAKFLLLSLAVCASLSSYAEEADYSNAIQVKIKNDSGLVVGGTTDQPILVEPDDNDDSQVFYMVQTSYNNRTDGNPATYPGFYLIQKSSGKYLIQNSWDGLKYQGTTAYTDDKTKYEYPAAKEGNWVPNDDATKNFNNKSHSQIDMNYLRALCAIDENNDAIKDIAKVIVGTSVGTVHKDTEGVASAGFRIIIYRYTGDVWLRGPGISGTSGDWNNGVKLEKDEANPGIYYHDGININDNTKGLRLNLQNENDTYTLNLSAIPNQEPDANKPANNKVSFDSANGHNIRFVPWQFGHMWQAKNSGVTPLTVDLNNMKLSLAKYNPIPTGIESIEAEENAPVHYYNLQGVEVANPENGIFIRVSGNKATKVVVKH